MPLQQECPHAFPRAGDLIRWSKSSTLEADADNRAPRRNRRSRAALWHGHRPADKRIQMLRELLATDERRALEFFFVHLRDVCEPAVAEDELLYNASLLAHYAQVSTATTESVPMLPSLSEVFDHFVIDPTAHDDSEMMETAAVQCLLLTGFFEKQMRRRHAIGWYAELGAGFFRRAAARQQSARKAQLLHGLSRQFEPWRRRHARLSGRLRDLPYLLPPPPTAG